MAAEIHQNDIGTDFQAQILDQDSNIVALSGYTLAMIFLKPNNTKLNVVPTLLTDGTDGKVHYISASGDIDQVGLWRFQARVSLGAQQWDSNILGFKVYPNL